MIDYNIPMLVHIYLGTLISEDPGFIYFLHVMNCVGRYKKEIVNLFALVFHLTFRRLNVKVREVLGKSIIAYPKRPTLFLFLLAFDLCLVSRYPAPFRKLKIRHFTRQTRLPGGIVLYSARCSILQQHNNGEPLAAQSIVCPWQTPPYTRTPHELKRFAETADDTYTRFIINYLCPWVNRYYN